MSLVCRNYYQDAIDSLPPEEEKMMKFCFSCGDGRVLAAIIQDHPRMARDKRFLKLSVL